MKFNPTKCFTITLASRKPTQNLYTCGQQPESVQSHCYLGVQISNALNWTAQCNSVARKAQQTLGVIKTDLNKCPTHIVVVACAFRECESVRHFSISEILRRKDNRRANFNLARMGRNLEMRRLVAENATIHTCRHRGLTKDQQQHIREDGVYLNASDMYHYGMTATKEVRHWANIFGMHHCLSIVHLFLLVKCY